MKKEYNSIIQYIDTQNLVVYSYITGKFYLINVNSLSPIFAKRIIHAKGKMNISHENLCEVIEKAQSPSSVDFGQFSYPLVVGLMVTNKCNLMCNYCIASHGNSYSQEDNFNSIAATVINELKDSSVVSVMVSGGEPTLYQDLPTFLFELTQSDFLCLLDTNGTHINDELLNTIKETDVIPRISIDSIYAEEHNNNRGLFNESYNNVIKMREMDIDLRINTVVNKINANRLTDLGEWLCSIGINKWHVFKLQQTFAPKDIWLSDDEVAKVISDLNERFANNIDILFKFSKTNDNYASFLIDSNGLCFSTQRSDNGYSEKKVFGDITHMSLSDIWKAAPLDYRLRHYNKYLSYAKKEI